MATAWFHAAWFPTSPLVILVALLSLLTEHPLAQGSPRARESEFSFPDGAYGIISGHRRNTTTSPSLRPSTSPRPIPESSAAASISPGGSESNYYGNQEDTAGVGNRPSAFPSPQQCTQQTISWNNVSPFHDMYITAGHQSLADARLAIDSMFRISNQLESLLRDPLRTNLIYSPLGLVSVLGQLMLAARGRTLDELLGLLIVSPSPGCNYNDLFQNSFRSVLAQLQNHRGIESYELSVKNALFYQPQHLQPLNRNFTTGLTSGYNTEKFATDFRTNPTYAQQRVNSWAQEASKGKIEYLMPSAPVRTTVAIISSIIYFKGIWENQFNKQFTSKGTFYLDGDFRGSTKAVDFMSAEFILPYIESRTLGCKMVVLPYTNNKTAMYLFMPLGSSKWKGPRPLSPLTVAPREGDKDDSLATRSGLTENLPVPSLNNENQTPTGQRTYYNVRPVYNNVQHRGWRLQTPLNGTSPYNRGYTYQWPYNTQRLKRRQADSQQEDARAHNPSQCQGRRCQPEALVGESPFSATKMHQLASRLSAEQFNSLVALAQQKQPTRVSLIIPKLSMTTNVMFKDSMTALNINTVFGKDADLSGAIDQNVAAGEGEYQENRWAVNEVWQQSRLEVTEEGTEAASGTAAGIIDYSLDSAIFKANSPFLIVIRHETTGTPIFWASVANPS